MKSILISIRPEWTAKILNGEKTIEIRRTAPKCDLPIEGYIYCTKGGKILYAPNGYNEHYWTQKHGPLKWDLRGKIVARFTLRKVENVLRVVGPYPCDALCSDYRTRTLTPSTFYDASCLSPTEIVRYGNGGNVYAWHISDLVIFDEPKELNEFMRLVKYRDFGKFPRVICEELRPLEKSPQSWCYCYVEEKE